MKAGVRVIRGPDWQSKRQDGGEGHMGTLVYVPKADSQDGLVTVIWDNGAERRYRAGKDSKYDLRVVDNAPTGVIHTTITCDECGEAPILGLRWKCGACKDYDLCTKCYMASKHDISHSFMRIDAEPAIATPVSPRKFAKLHAVKGVYKGATVIRGPHWQWKNDDGSCGENGKVIDVVDWQKNHPRGGAKVKWNATKKEGVYRLGGEGKVDVIFEEPELGGQYFFEHLPLVDVINPGEISLKNGDKVRVSLDEDKFKSLQDIEAYGGWSDGMKQCIEEVGTVTKLLYEGKAARVQYLDCRKWTVNRAALYRIHSFSQGEAVKILEDVNTVRELQEGHGGWNSDMQGTLGAIGRIALIDSDGDLRVKIKDKIWIFSPVCCNTLEDTGEAADIPQLTKSEMDEGDVDDLKIMQRDMERMAGVLAQLFVGLLKVEPDGEDDGMSIVEAAAKGDLERVKQLVSKNPDKVNATHENKTALQLASYEGQVPVIKYLLEKKADVNTTDDEGDTALHYSAFGMEKGSMDLLLEAGANVNNQNKKGLTSLHITIGKATVPCTELLVAKGASVNLKDKDGDSPMHDCIIQSEKQSALILAIFMAKGADFSVSNAKGFNILQWAALKDCRQAADIVIQKSPQLVDSKMKEGFTTLHICAANDHVAIASDVVQKGKANVNMKDSNGRTALHVAVSQSNKRMVELLLTFSCNVNEQDDEGNTALHVAQVSRALPDQLARLLGVPVVKDDTGIQISCLLLEAGASITVKNKKEKTPLDLCTDFTTREFLRRLAEEASKKKLPTSTKGVHLPAHWDKMDRKQSMARVHLDDSNGLLKKEFQEVRNKFNKTMPQAHIVKIERVQNKFLWEHYYFKRNQMEADYGKGCANELDLYHGTRQSLVEVIAEQNFDPRLAGDNVGTLFGQGAYFATEAKYSDGYAEPDKNHHKFIFQCRVLAGKWTYGDPKLRRPPVNSTPEFKKSGSVKLYDCCVDNTDRPKIFCLFDINQYYPEYIIEYK